MSASTLNLECPHCGKPMDVEQTKFRRSVRATCQHWDCRFEGWTARSAEELVELHADELAKEVS